MLRNFLVFGFLFFSGWLGAEEINVYLRTKPLTVHPFTNSDRSFIYLSYFWHHPLIALSDTWQWQCVLCDDLPTIENGKVEKLPNSKGLKVLFRFRKDATWGDGKPLKGNDVKLSFEIARSLAATTPRINSFSMIREVGLDPKDPLKFYLYFEEEGLFYEKLSQISFVPSHIEERIWNKSGKQPSIYLEESAYALTPTLAGLYSGSLVLDKFDASTNSPLEMLLHPSYKKKSSFSKIKAIFTGPIEDLIGKAEADPLALVPECVIDESVFLEKTDFILSVMERKSSQWLFGDAYSFEHVDLNLRNPILKDSAVRKALAYALDREAIYRNLFRDYVTPAVGSFHPKDPYFSPDIDFYEYDPEKAKKLLNQERWVLGGSGIRKKDDHLLRVSLLSSDAPARRKILDIIAKSWQAVGVDVVKEVVSSQHLLPRLARADYEAAALSGWRLWFDHSQRPLYGVRFDPSVYNLYRGLNASHWVNMTADQLFVNYSAEFDLQARKGLMANFQKIYSNELPSLPLFYYKAFALPPKNLVGFKIAGHQFPSSLMLVDWKKKP